MSLLAGISVLLMLFNLKFLLPHDFRELGAVRE